MTYYERRVIAREATPESRAVKQAYNPQKDHRRSLRLPGYDYAQPGAYFITVCVHDRRSLFGELIDGQIRLNEVGRMVERWWRQLPNRFALATVDEFVVMPNHIHGIVINVGADPRVRPGPEDGAKQGAHIGAPLPRIVRWFKTMTTNEYIRNVRDGRWPPSSGRLWQRNYYEHVVRNDDDLNTIRQYILDNPAKWDEDTENPRNFENAEGQVPRAASKT